MRTVVVYAIVATVVAVTVPLAASDEPGPPNKQVVLYIEDPGKFEVLHSRAKSTSTGAAFFGLIGAGIEEGHRKSDDTKKETAILSHIPDDACHSYMTGAFTARLEEKGFEAGVVHGKPGKSAGDSYAIRLRIDACGYRMVDTIDEEMAAYVVAQYRIYKPGEKTSGKLLELTMIGKDRRPWNDLLSNAEGAVEEFRDAKRRVGLRLANKIVYMRPHK